MSQLQVYKIPLKHDEEIQFSIKAFKGNLYFDLRIYFQSKQEGTTLPSRKGLTLGTNLLQEFRKGLNEIQSAVDNQMVPVDEKVEVK